MKNNYKSCKYCGRVHPINYKCSSQPQKKKYKYDTKSIKIRNTKAWRNVREAVKHRDHHLCQVCLDSNIINCERLEVHHIIPIKEDETQAYNEDNLITLCRMHHEQAENGELEKDYLKKLIPPRC